MFLCVTHETEYGIYIYIYAFTTPLHSATTYTRTYLLRHMELVDGWQDGEEGAKLVMILEQACIGQGVGREL